MTAKKDYITVSQLNQYIKQIVNAEEMLHGIYIAGEVSGFKISAGNAYFDLKDKDSKIACNCWSAAKTYRPRDGESVLLFGSLDYWPKGGRLSFNALRIEPVGQGLLAYQLEQLKIKLRDEGYFDESNKQPIPKFPHKVGVLTSRSGAVIRDIVTTVRKSNHIIDIKVFDVRVQGENAAPSIIRGLKTLDKLGFDVIIIARGGGSLEELMPFNDENLVYAVFEAKTPVISAVGHETDFTLCDFVADLRVPTPTAAAEFIAFNTKQLREQILSSVGFVRDKCRDKIERIYENLKFCTERLKGSADSLIDYKERQLKELIMQLDANNPARILAQGYFKIKRDNIEVKSVEEVKKGDAVIITGADGEMSAEILETRKK